MLLEETNYFCTHYAVHVYIICRFITFSGSLPVVITTYGKTASFINASENLQPTNLVFGEIWSVTKSDVYRNCVCILWPKPQLCDIEMRAATKRFWVWWCVLALTSVGNWYKLAAVTLSRAMLSALRLNDCSFMTKITYFSASHDEKGVESPNSVYRDRFIDCRIIMKTADIQIWKYGMTW